MANHTESWRNRVLIMGLGSLLMVGVLWLQPAASKPITYDEPQLSSSSTDPKLKFIIEPYLQYPTQTSMVVMWETNQPGSSVVEYGEPGFVVFDEKKKTHVPPKLSKRIEFKDQKTVHEVTLKDLKPSSKYLYRVITRTDDGAILESDIFTLMTAVRPDEAWSFTVVGDTQRNPVITGRIAKQMWERRPNFVLHCGDVVDEGPDKKQWTDDLFTPSEMLFRRVAVLPTIGNHEKNHEHYYRYFSVPAPKYYYRFRYGNADFFAIDSNKIRDLSPKGEQYQWLDKELAKSDATWKIVFHHHPAYSSDDDDFGYSWYGRNGDGEPRVQQHFIGLYEKHKVDLVFNGHVHVYERTWPVRGKKVDHVNGTIYITSGGGGGTLEDFSPTPHWFKAEQRSVYHYCYLTVHEARLNFKAFDVDGRLFDSMTLDKKR